MPKELEEKLKRQAKKKGFGKKRTNAYVYGTLRKTGWEPGKSSIFDEIQTKAKAKRPK